MGVYRAIRKAMTSLGFLEHRKEAAGRKTEFTSLDHKSSSSHTGAAACGRKDRKIATDTLSLSKKAKKCTD